MIQQYMSEVSKKPRLTPEQERTATPAELVESNLRLVIHIARRWKSRDEHDLMDRIQDGNVGLMAAAQKFDGSRGVKFSTYAAHWINDSIRQGLRRSERVVKPSEMGRRVAPTVFKLAADGLRAHEIAQLVDLPVDEVQWLIGGDYVSFDDVDPPAEDDDLDLVHVLAKAARVLDELEQTVLSLYLEGYSAEGIGREIGMHRVTAERIKARNVELLQTRERLRSR